MTAESLGRFDVVVVGAGAAGMCVAIEAASAGASVLVVEKQSEVGGMLHIANGEFSGAGTRRQAAHGIDDTPERHFEDVMRLSHGRADEDLVWRTVRAQGDTVDWLESLDFDFDPGTPGLVHGHEVYSVPRTYWGVDLGRSLLRLLGRRFEDAIEAGAVRLLLGTRIQGALTDGGRVTGVTGIRPDGGEMVAHGDAVVLATGGYDADPSVRNRFLPPGCENALIACLDHATGDGLTLALTLGADVSADGFFIPVMGLIPDPARSGFAVDYREAFVQVAPAYRTPYEIWVNQDGRRFVAEDGESPERRERELLRQPGLAMHIVWDRSIAETAEPLIGNGTGDWTRERMLAECEAGRWIVAADSLRDLAERLGVDADGLIATVERYNVAVRSGNDPEYGRVVLPMTIGTPPYYGLTSVAASLLSRDGVRVDGDLSVLNRAGTPITGLFAVGEVLGNNVFAGDNYVGGMSVTPAMTLGRELGRALGAAAASRSISD
ncbi:FAD-dependent oxidoreductase [Streptosporangium amethystogenes]|uniref:FAD-dependent oxidoreductase n=1 Tax=Streptosporangium amethystogenes TaxID=2002 RepID=UPI0004CB21B8|nr:FAD-dependent oxidoreductase [Streptosporangium amethystogenes]